MSVAQVNADFNAPVTSGCSPLIVNFQNTSTGSGLSYQWNLGNGNNSTSENPSASYITPGTYTVTLTATDGTNNDVETKTAYITVFTPPVPDISPSQTIVCYPYEVNFTDLSSAGDSPINNWSWDFGDGGTSTNQHPSHTYTTPGIFDITLILTDANGCTSNKSFSNLIESNNNKPAAAYTANTTVGCLPPVDVTFSNTSSGGTGTLVYDWSFGDGNTSTATNPTNAYTTAGNFEVSLTVTDDLGCSSTLAQTDYINIVDNVTIDFKASATTTCLGNSISFSDLSSSNPTSWLWDFGDGKTSATQNPTHLYTSPGTYEVSLTAFYSASCQGSETKTGYITINEAPFVNFTEDATSSCEIPFTVNFTNNSSSADPLTYLWNFGNGTTSNLENPPSTYLLHGVYTVSLTATTSNGCNTTVIKNDLINITETTADFLPDAFGFCQPLEVNFQDSSTSASNIVSYRWYFGDGSTSNVQNPTYEYPDTGIFDVSLAITNDIGCTDSVTRENYIFVYTPPVADFQKFDTIICPGELTFTDNSLNVTDWFWSFGNTGTSTDQNPTYEFQDTGFYSITLIALNNGCSDTLKVDSMIYVSPPIAGYEMTHDCSQPNTFTFKNESYGYTSTNWLLPDGSTSTEDPITLTFPAPGYYIMRVEAFNSNTGCTDMAGDTVHVTELKADFSALNTEDCGPLSVPFLDKSVQAVSYEWFFGDGSYSYEQNPTYTYNKIGTYTVKHVVSDINGCTDTVVSPNLVTVTGSIIDFDVASTAGCDTLHVQFADLSTPAGTITEWSWDFGDGTNSTAQNPLHPYLTAGLYNVSLTIKDNRGCNSSISYDSIVNYIPYPIAAFTADSTEGCIGDIFQFNNESTNGAVSYLWDFGDGTTSTDENPTHIYAAAGTYNVSLTAYNANGCEHTVVKNSLIDIRLPTADFTAFPTFAFCPPLLVDFTNTSSKGVVSWFWDFGDGSSSNLSNPSHIYTESGLFSVSLVVTNSFGCTDTLLMPDLIELSGPSGEFSFFPDTIGCPPYDITYVSTAENVTKYTWDFGDGSLGSGSTSTHTYAALGAFIPSLILEDNNGCVFTYQSEDTLLVQPLSVDAGVSGHICKSESLQLNASGGETYSWSPITGLDNPNSPNPIASPNVTTNYVVTVQLGKCVNTDTATVFVDPTPTVNFQATEVCLGAVTEFTDLSSIASPDSILSWSWDFSNGLSNDTNPSVVYDAPGRYPVSLMVEGSSGCNGYKEDSITVYPFPNASFQTTDACQAVALNFEDNSSIANGTIVDWTWQFGDGFISSNQNAIHTYTQDSTFTVKLIVEALGGCTDTATTEVTVHPSPKASYATNNVCFNELVAFSDSSTISTGVITTWNWDFGDNANSSEQHPNHLYETSQTFDFTLTVASDQGCEDTTFGAVTVYPLPVSNFSLSASSSCVAPVSVNATNNSQGGNEYLWDLDDGTTANTFNATPTYDTIGAYTIELLVTTQ
ncbi:PKD domain-containing protein, partial [Bacteroidota bacterium]